MIAIRCVRVKPKYAAAARVENVPKTVGVRDGKPVVEGGRMMDDVANVVWCVGFRHDLSWIDLPISGRTERGCAPSAR